MTTETGPPRAAGAEVVGCPVVLPPPIRTISEEEAELEIRKLGL